MTALLAWVLVIFPDHTIHKMPARVTPPPPSMCVELPGKIPTFSCWYIDEQGNLGSETIDLCGQIRFPIGLDCINGEESL